MIRLILKRETKVESTHIYKEGFVTVDIDEPFLEKLLSSGFNSDGWDCYKLTGFEILPNSESLVPEICDAAQKTEESGGTIANTGSTQAGVPASAHA
jgi:hypothetical protein